MIGDGILKRGFMIYEELHAAWIGVLSWLSTLNG